ncbi:hypothetical protein Forpe1208_v015956 [Fusarium oxysporum f. sp. rapae]|uniref:Uncharacterized protein n=1 Tax=Fusarium oxysporum f. sp. rapae TaxID=485398 RepID=A0A8J5TXW5_FUSOX|nr:hypothetical protein Forpe1208_v015956 [Fusarium oxysporum f. sp. rapae]
MGLKPTKEKFNNIAKGIHVQFKFAKSIYNKKYPDKKIQLTDYWIVWIMDYYAQVVKKFKENVSGQITEIQALLDGVDNDLSEGLRTIINHFKA